MNSEVNSLQLLTRARQMLAEAKTLPDLVHIRDLAEAARVYAQAARLGLESQNEAAEIKLRAERRAGEILAQMEKHPPGPEPVRSLRVTEPPTLADMDITKMQSSRWQQMADFPEEKFEEYIAHTRESGVELTTVGMLRYVRQTNAQENTPTLEVSTKYRVIYADPPWNYGNMMPVYSSGPDDYYPTMSLASLCAMPVQDIVEKNAVLFLWATSPMLEESFRVIKAWGFSYKASFIWDKVKHVMGFYNSVRHEFLLVCTRGSCTPDVKHLFDSVVSIERGEHSAKPEYFREIIDTLYPVGKRIELFARGESHGDWERWGNEPAGD